MSVFKKIFVFKKVSLPVQLIVIFGISLLLGGGIPLFAKELAYTLSVLIQDVLGFVLPIIIFSYLFSSMVQLKDGALSFILLLLAGVCLSNWVPLFYTFGISHWAFGDLEGARPAFEMASELRPLWKVSLPNWVSNDFALCSGLFLGCLFAYFPNQTALEFGSRLNRVSHTFLSKVFIPVVPLFVLGFVLKLQHEGTLQHMVRSYAPLLALMIGLEALYLALYFGLASGFNPKRWRAYLRNAMPSMITGFSTMSSAASLPVTLQGAEKNCDRPELARVIVPATANIHMVGDSITIPLIAFFVMASYGKTLPDIWGFLPFSFYFVLSKFAVAGVPGGGVIALLPVFERCFGFDSEMLSVITAMYLILDSLNTITNVGSNGAFAILFSKFYSWTQTPKKLRQPSAKVVPAKVSA